MSTFFSPFRTSRNTLGYFIVNVTANVRTFWNPNRKKSCLKTYNLDTFLNSWWNLFQHKSIYNFRNKMQKVLEAKLRKRIQSNNYFRSYYAVDKHLFLKNTHVSFLIYSSWLVNSIDKVCQCIWFYQHSKKCY